MTRFDDLQDIIKRNKKISLSNKCVSQDDSIEVSGLTDSDTGQPRIEFARNEDMPLVDHVELTDRELSTILF